jgi:L-asparaginase II
VSETPPPLVQVLRGGLVESVHRGHLAAVSPEGRLLVGLGDPDFPLFLRSAAKPLQALPVVEEGAADRFGLTAAELALLCGSVAGAETHVAAVRSVLAKGGLEEDLLACGAQRPADRAMARRLDDRGEPYLPVHNACAGKHAGMLLLCAHKGWEPKGYLLPEHPLQRLIRQTVAELCAIPPEAMGVAVDGCGVPTFQVPLRAAARAYARLAAPKADRELSQGRRAALRRLMDAAAEHPEMIAGDGLLCTELIRAAAGGAFAKFGAEASYGLALRERAIGVVFKVEDGGGRAAAPAAVACLGQLQRPAEDGIERLRRFERPLLRNHRNEVVGELVPAFELRAPGL